MKAGYKATKKETKATTKGYLMSPGEMKPTVCLNSDLLPDVKNWKVGKTYNVMLELKMTGLHQEYDSTALCGDFQVQGAEEDEED